MGNRQRGIGCLRADTEGAEAPLPAEPCAYLPGSDEKIAVLVQRETRNECLFHPRDATRDDDLARPPEWLARLPDGDELDGIYAISKSEARAILKDRLGLPRRVGLPYGTILERIDQAAGDLGESSNGRNGAVEAGCFRGDAPGPFSAAPESSPTGSNPMTQDEEFRLYDEAIRIHLKAREMGRDLFPEERQRVTEISRLLAPERLTEISKLVEPAAAPEGESQVTSDLPDAANAI